MYCEKKFDDLCLVVIAKGSDKMFVKESKKNWERNKATTFFFFFFLFFCISVWDH